MLVLSLPWIAAELGFHLPGDLFMGQELFPTADGHLEAAVHLGEHHGWHGSLLLLSALVLSRVQSGGRLRIWLLVGTAALAAYGAVNAAQDFWQEQLVKRGNGGLGDPERSLSRPQAGDARHCAAGRARCLALGPRAGDTTSMSSAPRMVFLGFGKYVRADRIYALEPIVGDDRGNGRRTLVWVEGMPEPMVASRTQQTILEEMGAESTAESRSAPAAGAPDQPQLFADGA